MKKYEIRVDEEYNGEEFGDAVSGLTDLLDTLAVGEPMVLEQAEKELLFKALAALPGWTGGPSHAPCPLLVTEVEPAEGT